MDASGWNDLRPECRCKKIYFNFFSRPPSSHFLNQFNVNKVTIMISMTSFQLDPSIHVFFQFTDKIWAASRLSFLIVISLHSRLYKCFNLSRTPIETSLISSANLAICQRLQVFIQFSEIQITFVLDKGPSVVICPTGYKSSLISWLIQIYYSHRYPLGLLTWLLY